MDLSDFRVASSALRCMRWINFWASSRSSLAASSRWTALAQRHVMPTAKQEQHRKLELDNDEMMNMLPWMYHAIIKGQRKLGNDAFSQWGVHLTSLYPAWAGYLCAKLRQWYNILKTEKRKYEKSLCASLS